MGHSAYMTLTDIGLPTDSFPDKGHQVTSHPTTDTGHEAHFHADTPDQVKSGSISVSGQLPTYPSPNPTLTLTCYQLTVVELGEG